MNLTKICSKCKGKPKKLEEFYKHKNHKDGVSSTCKICHNKMTKAWRDSHPDSLERSNKATRAWQKRNPDKVKNIKLFNDYGLTLKQYNKLLEKQGECCGICGIHKMYFNKKLNVDHNHKTGKIRGLLCSRCNTGLGMFLADDGPNLLAQAYNYIRLNQK